MRMRMSGKLSILVLRRGARAPLHIAIPYWLISVVHTCALTVFGFIGFCGWHMQGRYGMSGQHVLYLGLDADPERWSLFERLGPSQLGPSREELQSLAAHARAQRLGLGTRVAASSLLTGVIAPAWADEAALGGDLGNGTLQWPVERGRFGRGYGSGEGGYHLAIDIEGPQGSEVMAAAPGIVGYVGNELRGYGNVVLVVHPGGWVTLYGHNERVLVHAGQRVRQGQQLADLGSTGRSVGPHVHFELIYQGRNCDPLPFVTPSEVEHLSAAEPVQHTAWNPRQAKPESVRCHRRIPHPQHEREDDDDNSSNLVGTAERTEQTPPG